MRKDEFVPELDLAISAVVNCHNSPITCAMLTRALDSVLAQENPGVPWEVVVVNDGKPDEDIVELAKVYAAKFEDKDIFFTFFGTEEESGYQCAPKNAATNLVSTGEYLAYLDYDNEWTPDHLKVLWEAMDAGVVWDDFTYGRRQYVRDEGCPETYKIPGSDKEVELKEMDSPFIEWTPQSVMAIWTSNLNNFIDTSDFLISRGALWRLYLSTPDQGMWNEGINRFADWELFARGSRYAGLRGKAVDKVVNIYHWTGHNVQLTRKVGVTKEKV